jgi:glycerol-1-phosphate dehydrogenase [NAD(P)+]
MIAAGLGDSLAKYTSVADFRLAHLIRDEIFDDEIARRMLATGQSASANVDAIAEGSAEGVTALLQALYDSGWCMVDFNNSRPASGTEHHYSHFWEMKLLSEGRHAILHGAKTGVGTILAARLWEQVRKLSRDEAADLLEAATMPDRDEEIATIRRIYGDGADEVIATQRPFLDMTPQQFDALKRKILDNWDVIQQIAADVPAPDQVASWLAQAGGPTTVAQLGLSDHEQYLAEHYSHYLRDRFTVRKLTRVLGLF